MPKKNTFKTSENAPMHVNADFTAYLKYSPIRRKSSYAPIPKCYFGPILDQLEIRKAIRSAVIEIKSWAKNPFKTGMNENADFDVSLQRIFDEPGSFNSKVKGLYIEIEFGARTSCDCSPETSLYQTVAERCLKKFDHMTTSHASIYIDLQAARFVLYFIYGIEITQEEKHAFRHCDKETKHVESFDVFGDDAEGIAEGLSASVKRLERYRKMIHQAQDVATMQYQREKAAAFFKEYPGSSFVVID